MAYTGDSLLAGPERVLMIGDPGVGKSAILNFLVGKPGCFQSGLAVGRITTRLQEVATAENVTYLDTPGLDDDEIREQAGKEIESALRRGGDYRIFFVITLEGGRIRAAQKTTMGIVLKACRDVPAFQYSVILNKVSAGSMKMYQDSNKELELRTLLFKDLNPPTSSIFFLPEKPEMADENNVMADFGARFREFVQKAPRVAVKPDKVREIDVRKMDELRAEFERTLKQMQLEAKADKEKADRAAKELQDRLAQQQKTIEDTNRRLEEERRRLEEERRRSEEQRRDLMCQRAQASSPTIVPMPMGGGMMPEMMGPGMMGPGMMGPGMMGPGMMGPGMMGPGMMGPGMGHCGGGGGGGRMNWNEFRTAHKGQGFSIQDMSRMYRAQR